MAMKSLKISVERLLEQEVDEINRAGEEKYIKPFNLSEELTYLAGKIDFYEGIQGHHDPEEMNEEDEKTEDSNSENKKEQKDTKHEEWHWSSVHSKLRIALSEVCVMLDVLQTLNKKRYLILDPIEQAIEPDKQTVQMLEKRKILAKVGNTIAKGASGLGIKSNKPETIVIDGSEEHDYYTQLMELRQFWRVKKSGNQITGDLSYHTSGSKFWHPGVFEVKAHGIDNDDEKTLGINISPDLMKDSEIQVQVIDCDRRFPWTSKTFPIQFEDNFGNPWEKNMSKAQHNLFNKEIFSQLSNDAFQGSFLGIDVLNSQIRCKILQNVEVIISHQFEEDSSVNNDFNDVETANDLKLLLHSLVYQQHRNTSKFPTPYPSTSNYFGKQSKSSSIINLLHRTHGIQQPSVLQEFLKQAEHKVWVHRVNSFLYQQSTSISEPNINFHWDLINSRLKSVVKVVLSTRCYHKSFTSNFLISINKDGFKVFSEDLVSLILPLDVGSLFRLMQTQIHNHVKIVIKGLCKLHGWSVVHLSTGKSLLASVQHIEGPIIISNFKKNKTASLKISDLGDIKIKITKDHCEKNQSTCLDFDFQSLRMPSFNIPWDCLPGTYLTEKIESLLLL